MDDQKRGRMKLCFKRHGYLDERNRILGVEKHKLCVKIFREPINR